MLIVGLENCSTCKIVKKLLFDIDYLELHKCKSPAPEILEIKKVLGKLNPTGHFPVVLDDDYSKIITTDVLLENLSKNKLQELLDSK